MVDIAENWLPVVGWEGWYEVSDIGRVKRVHIGRGGNTHIGRILKLRLLKTGYYKVVLHRKPARTIWLVHRLVAMAFVANPETLPCVNHKNGVKTDNAVGNLEWVTYSDNTRHALRIGLLPTGAGHPNAKLSAAAVRDIRKRYVPRKCVGELAAKYDVVPSTIWRVATRKGRSYE